MDRQSAQLKQNIARIRRDIRLHCAELQSLLDSERDCTSTAQKLIRAQSDLMLFIEKQDRLQCQITQQA
jgi:hypothetical protein